MRGYIAGPMAGIEGFNSKAFYGAEAALSLAGWEVVNPARFGDDSSGVDHQALTVSPGARAWFLKRDLGFLVDCDAIFMLYGWEASAGANVELTVAQAVGMPVFILEWDSAEGWWYWRAAPTLSPMSGEVRRHIALVQKEVWS